MRTYRSWGWPASDIQAAKAPVWSHEIKTLTQQSMGVIAPDNTSISLPDVSILPFGNGLSYGDSCLNSEGLLLDTCKLNRVQHFDKNTGLLRADPGVTMHDILSLALPHGWCVPVSPGTGYVTLGGAVANDVHGKNHHVRGSFGTHVKSFTLVRSSEQPLHCSAHSNCDLFKASIGGLGLTGLMLDIEISLIPVKGSLVDCINLPFHGLDEFSELSERYKSTHEYTVAWLDCLSTRANAARGIFTVANHSENTSLAPYSVPKSLTVPFNLPATALNRFTMNAFNSLYFFAGTRAVKRQKTVPLAKLFYPLDAVRHWNRIYGAQGFFQFQFVVPPSEIATLTRVLSRVRGSGLGSFLAVLKIFGSEPSPGMLSFARPGYCLALDFTYRQNKTEPLLKELETMVIEAGGAIYPAKDRLMSAESFAASFPRIREFERYRDNACQSDYWQRVKPCN